MNLDITQKLEPELLAQRLILAFILDAPFDRARVGAMEIDVLNSVIAFRLSGSSQRDLEEFRKEMATAVERIFALAQQNK